MRYTLLIFISISTLFFSCKKEPGQGGRATIKGTVYIDDYDNTYTILKSIYPAQGENVYILYGEDNSVADNTKTSYDGTFEFSYLRTGKYKIFVVSKDTADKISNKTIEVLRSIEITEKKQIVAVDDLHIAD